MKRSDLYLAGIFAMAGLFSAWFTADHAVRLTNVFVGYLAAFTLGAHYADARKRSV